MRSMILLLLSFFSLVSLASDKAPPSLIKNPLAASITSIFVVPQEDNFKRGSVTVLPNRDDVYLMEDLAQLRFTYRLQENRKAPLMFVIPGTGGNSEAGGALFLAERFFKMGYHTVVVENPFYWGFAVSSSRRGLPGYTPDDSDDLYLGLQKIMRQLKTDKGVRPRSFSLSGYSLGALQSLFLQRTDQENRKFNFEKILLINPPADLLYAVTSIDRLYSAGDTMSAKRKKALMYRIYNVGGKYLDAIESFKDPQFIQKVYDELAPTNQEMAYLIGQSFRETIRDVVFASQQVKDLGVLKIRATRNRQNARWDEAMTVSFGDYIGKFLYPQLAKSRGAGYSIQDLNAESSIYQFGEAIKASNNIYLITSADDLIVQRQDIPWFQEHFGDRALIFPYGGHCGAMNFPQFQKQLQAIFKLR
jgi:predicted alpha/beta-fold hydrolase